MAMHYIYLQLISVLIYYTLKKKKKIRKQNIQYFSAFIYFDYAFFSAVFFPPFLKNKPETLESCGGLLWEPSSVIWERGSEGVGGGMWGSLRSDEGGWLSCGDSYNQSAGFFSTNTMKTLLWLAEMCRWNGEPLSNRLPGNVSSTVLYNQGIRD